MWHLPRPFPDVGKGVWHLPPPFPEVGKGAWHLPPPFPDVGKGVWHLPPGFPGSGETAWHLPLAVPDVGKSAWHLPRCVPDVGKGAWHLPSGVPGSGETAWPLAPRFPGSAGCPAAARKSPRDHTQDAAGAADVSAAITSTVLTPPGPRSDLNQRSDFREDFLKGDLGEASHNLSLAYSPVETFDLVCQNHTRDTQSIRKGNFERVAFAF